MTTLHFTLAQPAAQLLEKARAQGRTIASAESCTGGLIAACLTESAGSSDVFLCGIVAYSNESKRNLLGVSAEILKKHGAVSGAAARAMAEGARRRTGASLALSTTGIAGPGGGSIEKPVGLVHIAAAASWGCLDEVCRFEGNRFFVRISAARRALSLGMRFLG